MPRVVVLPALLSVVIAAAPASPPAPREGLSAARERVDAFYRNSPGIDPDHLGSSGLAGPLCRMIVGHSPWVETTLLEDLNDPGSTDWLRRKILFGLSCVRSAGESRCLGSLATGLIAMNDDPDLSPPLRRGVASWLELLSMGSRVPLVDLPGGYRRRDYGRWWNDGGQWRIHGTCGDART